MKFHLSSILIVSMICVFVTQSTSKYEGVTWNKNPEISTVPSQQYQKKEKTSQYKSVYWNKERKTWDVLICPKGQTPKFGGYFTDELDAAKRVNQICEKLEIPLQNPEICAKPNQQYREKEVKSQYKGVYWKKQIRKWCVQIYPKEQKAKFGGYFKDEVDAVERVNQLSEEFEIPLLNRNIGAVPNQQYQKKEKTSQYKGVYWQKERKIWIAVIRTKEQKHKYGGSFEDELDAAKGVNQLCKEFGIPLQNPEIGAIPNEQYEKKRKRITI